MTSLKPVDPALNDTWVDDVGDLYTWDGENWILFEDTPPFIEPKSILPEA
jgi:hypothetical protein